MKIHIHLEDLKYRDGGEYQTFSFRPDFGRPHLLKTNTAPQCCVFEIEKLIPNSISFSSPRVNSVAPENKSSGVIYSWHYRYDVGKIRDFYSSI